MMERGNVDARISIPTKWTRAGLVLPRAAEGPGSHVVGDPSIVWDATIGGWRMVMFFDPPGHGQAICRGGLETGAGKWELVGPLDFTNPEMSLDGKGWTHKPYVVTEARRPNIAARVDERYWLVSVSFMPNRRKVVQRAWARALAGPWTWESGPLIPQGGPGEFDEEHTDAVSGLYFPEREEFVYYYMGYPVVPQKRAISPLGSAEGVAVQKVGEKGVRKLGIILGPEQQKGHWASGYVGGVQVLPGKEHRWIAMANASPTAPVMADQAVSREEPPPSLGGFAVCDEEFPVKGWRWCAEPIEWIEQMPAEALAAGEGVNLWRQHVVVLPGGRMVLFYNSGTYGKEQMFAKLGG